MSLPPEFFQIISDELEHSLRLLDSQQAVFQAARAARENEPANEAQQADAAVAPPKSGATHGADGLDRLVRDLLGKDLDELRMEQAESLRQTYPVASEELYHIAELLGAQARHRIDRLAVAFDKIAGEPVRRELARRRIEQSGSQRPNDARDD